MRGDDGERDGLLPVAHAVEPFPDLPDADGLHNREGRIEILPAQGLDLFNRPAREHGLEALRDAAAEHVPVGREDNALDLPAVEQAGLRIILKSGERLAGRAFDGKRADDALRIGDFQAVRRFGVFPEQQVHAAGFVERLHLALNLQRRLR